VFRHLYIHLPYCVEKCPYCDFFSVADDHRRGEFLDLLEREFDGSLREHGDLADVETVFVGGGTPTHLSERDIERFGVIVQGRLNLAPGYEWTVEANPESATREKLALFRDMGATRISMGAQSFDDRELRILGRVHASERIHHAADAIRSAGFVSWSLDLIFGVAGQSPGSWSETIDRALALDPPHISAYALMIEPGSEYARDADPLRFQADDDVVAEQFLHLMDRLSEAGYEHYEVSSYAQPGERCRHNDAYWLRLPYLGLGPSAHSLGTLPSGDERRWWNTRSIDGYLDAVAQGTSPVAGSETLTGGDALRETIMLGLRRAEGIEWGSLPSDSHEAVRQASEPLAEAELVECDDWGMRLVREGWLVADGVILRVVDAAASATR